MIERMKMNYKNDGIWINKYELEALKCEELKEVLLNEKFCKHMGIDMSNIHSIKQYIWELRGNDYEQFQKKRTREYIDSAQMTYPLNKDHQIYFHFEICAKYCDDEPINCALFIHLDTLPTHVKEILIEFDVIGTLDGAQSNKLRKHKHSITAQWLSKDKNYCGSQIFPSRDLPKYTSICWKIGAKILDIEYENDYLYINDTEPHFDMEQVKDALQQNDTTQVLEMFRHLQTANHRLNEENQKIRDENTQLKEQKLQKVWITSPKTPYSRSKSKRRYNTSISPFASPQSTPLPLLESKSISEHLTNMHSRSWLENRKNQSDDNPM